MALLFVALGNSLRAGYITLTHSAPYTRFLEELIERKLRVRVQIINAGLPGDTTRGMLKRLETDVLHTLPTTSSSGAASTTFTLAIDLARWWRCSQKSLGDLGVTASSL